MEFSYYDTASSACSPLPAVICMCSVFLHTPQQTPRTNPGTAAAQASHIVDVDCTKLATRRRALLCGGVALWPIGCGQAAAANEEVFLLDIFDMKTQVFESVVPLAYA